MPFNFITGFWDRDPDVVFECIPAPKGGSRINYQSGGMIYVRKLDGKLQPSVDPAESIRFIQEGEKVILLEGGEFTVSFDKVIALPDEEEKKLNIHLKFCCSISEIDICDQKIIREKERVTIDQIQDQLFSDSGFSDLLESLLDDHGESLRIKDFKPAYEEFFTIDFGLNLRRVTGRINTHIEEEVVLEPGVIINNHYRIVKKIKSGAIGDIWLVEDIHTNNIQRALKSIKDESLIPYLRKEIECAARLVCQDHKKDHLVDFIGVVPGKTLMLLYEYIDGLQLCEYWNPDRRTNAEIHRIITQILRGISEIHRLGLVHRDLHYGNVMITNAEACVKVLDLGFAVEPGPREDDSEVGSIRMFVPDTPFVEMGGEDCIQYDSKTDLYSIGVIIWWMITGKTQLPRGKSLNEHIPERYAAFQPLIERACIVPRGERYTSASKMQDALDQAIIEPIQLKGNEKGVYAIAFQPSGNGFATGGRDGNVLYWDMCSLCKIVIYKHQKKEILALAFLNEEEFAVVQRTESAHEIQIVNLKTEKVRTIKSLDCNSISADISPKAGLVCIGTYQGMLVFSLENGKDQLKHLLEVDGEREMVNCVAFSRNGEYLAGGTSNGTVIVHNLNNGKTKRAKWKPSGAIWTLCFNHNATNIILGGNDRQIHIMTISSLIDHDPIEIGGQTHGLASHPSRNMYAIGMHSGKVRLWDYGFIDRYGIGRENKPVWALAFSPNGEYLVFGENKGVEGLISICLIK